MLDIGLCRLSDAELVFLAELQNDLRRVSAFVKDINRRAAESCLPIRQAQLTEIALMGNDISRLVASHELAVKAEREAVLERLAA